LFPDDDRVAISCMLDSLQSSFLSACPFWELGGLDMKTGNNHTGTHDVQVTTTHTYRQARVLGTHFSRQRNVALKKIHAA
jgi:hypothetical protein